MEVAAAPGFAVNTSPSSESSTQRKATSPTWRGRRWSVDILEYNTVLGAQGTEVLRQVVLWRWREWKGEHDFFVVDWKLATQCTQPERINGKWVMRFAGQIVEANILRDTIGNYDPEVLDRERLPINERR